MKLSPVNIGGIQTPNNIFLAPLAGYTNYPFRRLCKELGAGLCYTEMVSAKGLKYGSENTEKYIDKQTGMFNQYALGIVIREFIETNTQRVAIIISLSELQS